MPKGRYAVQAAIPGILTNLDNGLPELARQMIHDPWLSIQQANEQVLGYDRALSRLAREDETAKRLLTIPGVGEQIATGVVASVPDPRLFKNSRQFAAWLGLVPRQYTTGGHVAPHQRKIAKRSVAICPTACVLLSGDARKSELMHIRAFTGVFNCNGDDVSGHIQVKNGVFVEVFGFNNTIFPEFDIQGIGIVKIAQFHG